MDVEAETLHLLKFIFECIDILEENSTTIDPPSAVVLELHSTDKI